MGESTNSDIDLILILNGTALVGGCVACLAWWTRSVTEVDAAQVFMPIAVVLLVTKSAMIGQARETDQFYRSKPSRHTDTQTDKDGARHRHGNGSRSSATDPATYSSLVQGRHLPGLTGRPSGHLTISAGIKTALEGI